MPLPLKAVHEALRIYGVVPEGELFHGLKRHNDSISDNNSVFVKVLGETNRVDSFHRELGAAELFPHAPQPLVPEVIFVDVGRNEKPRWIPCTAWVFYEGVDVDAKTLTDWQAQELAEQLRRIYRIPLDSTTFPLPDIHFAAVHRRMEQAEEFTPDHLKALLPKILELVQHTELLLSNLQEGKELRRVLIHGDPHLGNVIELTDKGKQQLAEYSPDDKLMSLMLLDYESMKNAPIEYDLACLYQDLIQVHDNPEAYAVILESFQGISMELHGEPLDEEVLNAYIQFRNISTLTYLLAFQDWDLVQSRLEAMMPTIETNLPPARLQQQIL